MIPRSQKQPSAFLNEENEKSSSASAKSRFANIRPLTATDAEAYLTVRLQALREEPPVFGSPPENEPGISETAERLKPTEERCFFGAFEGDQLIGIVRIFREPAPKENHRAFLGGLYVCPEFRRLGCAKALLQTALEWAAHIPGLRRVNLTVVTGQLVALRLYESLGFQKYGTEKESFSKDGQFYDEHLMTLELNSDG